MGREVRPRPERNETEAQRWDRNFNELLQELRVAQTGIQILFAFLLTLVFQNRFAQVTTFQKTVYLVALVSAAGATAMIIAPVAYHRMLFQRGRKPEVVRSAHRMAIGGLAFLGVSMTASVLLVTDVAVGLPWSAVFAAVVAFWFALLWWWLPFIRRNDNDRVPDQPDGVAQPPQSATVE